MNIKFFPIILFLLASSISFSQADSIHIPWDLEGADERIEEIRKGNVRLEFRLPDGTLLSEQVPVKFELAKHDFIFGTAMSQTWSYDHDSEKYKKYLERVRDLFNYTTQTIFWSQAHKTEGSISVPQYHYENIQWAHDNNLSIKGMPLLWHNVLPDWLKESSDSAAIDAAIRYHFQYLIEEFPEISEWGVYNEAVAAFKAYVEESGVTRWVEYMGGVTPAVEFLFNLVNEIAPNKKYINNHYDYKDQAFKDLNQHLISTESGLGAVGIQTHMHDEPNMYSETEVWNFLDDYAPYGNIQLTEITVPSSVPFKDWREIQEMEALIRDAWQTGKPRPFRPSTSAWETYQAAYLKDFYTLAFSHPAVEALIYWTASDLNAWRGAAGGLLDMEHNPKPAYDTLKKLIKEEWHTRIDDQTQSDGSINFVGFYGEYKGFLTINDINYQINFSHTKGDLAIVIEIDNELTCETKYATDTRITCENYTWIDGNTYKESNNEAVHIIRNSEGCDSIVTLDLTISKSTTGTDVQTACDSYTWIDGNTYTESNTEATIFLTNSLGCDSVVSLDLEIITIDNRITQLDTMLMAHQENAAYQWLNCNDNSWISNETGQYFIPDSSGIYAVIISLENCSDTSDCESITVVGIPNFSRDDILIYPNPTRSHFYLQTRDPNEFLNHSVLIWNALGEVIYTAKINEDVNKIEFCSEINSGFYFVSIINENAENVLFQKLLIQ